MAEPGDIATCYVRYIINDIYIYIYTVYINEKKTKNNQESLEHGTYGYHCPILLSSTDVPVSQKSLSRPCHGSIWTPDLLKTSPSVVARSKHLFITRHVTGARYLDSHFSIH